MNLASWIILIVIVGVCWLDIHYLMKNGLEDCSGSCSSCGTSCKWVGDVKKAQAAVAREKKLKAFFHLK